MSKSLVSLEGVDLGEHRRRSRRARWPTASKAKRRSRSARVRWASTLVGEVGRQRLGGEGEVAVLAARQARCVDVAVAGPEPPRRRPRGSRPRARGTRPPPSSPSAPPAPRPHVARLVPLGCRSRRTLALRQCQRRLAGRSAVRRPAAGGAAARRRSHPGVGGRDLVEQGVRRPRPAAAQSSAGRRAHGRRAPGPGQAWPRRARRSWRPGRRPCARRGWRRRPAPRPGRATATRGRACPRPRRRPPARS